MIIFSLETWINLLKPAFTDMVWHYCVAGAQDEERILKHKVAMLQMCRAAGYDARRFSLVKDTMVVQAQGFPGTPADEREIMQMVLYVIAQAKLCPAQEYGEYRRLWDQYNLDPSDLE